jgi:hypothetical protein
MIAIIGGPSIPYAAISMNKRIGITIGGTKYFMVFPLLGDRISGTRRRHLSSDADALAEVGAGITTGRRVLPPGGRDRATSKHENTS